MSLFYKFTNSQQIQEAAQNGVFERSEWLGKGVIDFCSASDKPETMCNQFGEKVIGMLTEDGGVQYAYPRGAAFPFSSQYCDSENVIQNNNTCENEADYSQRAVPSDEVIPSSTERNDTGSDSFLDSAYEYATENPGKSAAIAIGGAVGLFGLYKLGKYIFDSVKAKPQSSVSEQANNQNIIIEDQIATLRSKFQDVSEGAEEIKNKIEPVVFDFSKSRNKRKLDEIIQDLEELVQPQRKVTKL